MMTRLVLPALAAVLCGAAGAQDPTKPKSDRDPTVLFAGTIRTEKGALEVQVTRRTHSIKPAYYPREERWMLGDLIEVSTVRAGAKDAGPRVVWRNFYSHDLLSPIAPRHWLAAACAGPEEGELWLVVSSGRWCPVLFRVSPKVEPLPVPVLPKGFEKVKTFRALSAEENRQRLAPLGYVDLPDDVWEPFRKRYYEKHQDGDHLIGSLSISRREKDLVFVTNGKTDRAARFRYDWEKRQWRIEGPGE